MDTVEFHSHLALKWDRKYDKNKSFITREKLFNAILERVVHAGDVWLDAGCGTGRFTRTLRKLGAGKVIGIDGSEDMVLAAKKLAPAHDQKECIVFNQSSCLDRLEYDNCYFDGIFCSSVIEYCGSPERVLGEFWRVLKPGGHLVVSFPNGKALIRTFEKFCFFLSKKLFGKAWPPYLLYVKNQYSAPQAVDLIKRSKFTPDHLELGGLGFGPSCLDRMKYWGPLIFIHATKN